MKTENYKEELEKSKKRLKELEEQDETGWSDVDLMYRGKDANLFLVKNHIKFYEDKLKSSLSGWL